jgi:hypothetical protein
MYRTDRNRARGLLVLAVAVSCFVMPRLVSGDDSSDNGEPEWNDSDLLSWISEIGGKESRYDDLASVQSFETLQRTIEEVKQMVLHDARTEQEAIEGLRMILKHLASTTGDQLDHDFKNPLFSKRDPRNRDIGAYNPDAEYDQAFIDGRYDYKLSGVLGTVPYVSITVNGRADSKLSRLVAYLDDSEIRKHARADGSYVLWLTKQKPAEPGAWIQLPDHASGIVIRQYVGNRKEDELASFAIEAVGDPLPNVESVTDEEIALRFRKASGYLAVSSTWHRTLLPEMRKRPNHFVSSSATSIGASAANSDNYYQMAYYEMGPDEALVVDFAPPKDIVYWNLTSATIWHESHRYLTDPVSLTSSEVSKQEGGTVRFVISRKDPGHPNWIKTFAHDRGFLIFRMVGVKEHPLPVVRKISAAEAGGLL